MIQSMMQSAEKRQSDIKAERGARKQEDDEEDEDI
jgi:hypothetical protein